MLSGIDIGMSATALQRNSGNLPFIVVPADNSYLAVADTEIGMGNRIPLWMFGLLY